MWFLNKMTGCKWDIYDKYHQERLMNDNNYEIIEEESFVIEEEVESADNVEIDYDFMTYPQLQEIAKEKGLKSVGISKENLIKSLQEGE